MRQPSAEMPEHLNQSWAALVSTIFKVAAWLVLLSGAVVGYLVETHLSSTSTSAHVSIEIVAGIAAATILIAASLAFFAYVLDLLIEIEWNTFDTAYPEAPQRSRRGPPQA
jgi:hypothetical protein